MKIGEIIAAELPQVASDTPLLDLELLLSHVLAKPRSYIKAWPEKVLTNLQYQHFSKLLSKRNQGEPIAYLLGYRYFWDMCLQVSNAVLIPRAETELLVAKALQVLANEHKPYKVLELGTGSGAIALAIAKHRTRSHVWATDISYTALQVARKNARDLHITNIDFLQGNWFAAICDMQFDLIISNPPYVAVTEKQLCSKEVFCEPEVALFAANDGFAELDAISREAVHFLTEQGWLLLEHGHRQTVRLMQHLTEVGFTKCYQHYDLAGIPRAILAQK